jgi:sortase A
VVPVGWRVVKEGGQRVIEWEVAEYAVGWHQNSAYPGQGGNIVLSGHHNAKGEVFRYLNDLNRGDEVILYAGGEAYPYQVAEKWLLLEEGAEPEARLENAQWMEPTEEERLTLITSWPYASRSHRLIVVAHPLF